MRLAEIVDNEPILVRLVKNLLDKQVDVYLFVNIAGAGGMLYHHEGHVLDTRMRHGIPASLKSIVTGDFAIEIVYEKIDATAGYKGSTTVVLDPDLVAETFNLTKRGESWEINNEAE